MPRLRNRIALPVCGLLLALSLPVLAAGYYGGGGFLDAELDLRYDSNLSRASATADVEEDMLLALSAGAGYLKTLDENSQLLISAYLAGERFSEFRDLDNIAVNTTLVYTIQPRAGYNQPWYEVSANVARRQFRNSAIRDSYFFRGSAGMGARLSDRITAELDYSFNHRVSDAKVFDTSHHELQARLIYAVSPALSLFSAYRLQVGETVSTATPTPAIRAAAESVAPDDVFSAGSGVGCTNRRCAYRLQAKGHFIETGAEYSINHLLSLHVSADHFIVDGQGVAAYRGWVYSAGLYLQF